MVVQVIVVGVDLIMGEMQLVVYWIKYYCLVMVVTA